MTMEYKLGMNLPIPIDKRNLRLRTVLRVLPPPPPSFDFDATLLPLTLPAPMFGNDQWGDCVVAGQANALMRMEGFEQKLVVQPTDNDCLKRYWKLQGAHCWNKHPDNGLNPLVMLNDWRKNGWKLNGKTYTIYAWGQVNHLDSTEVMQCASLLEGIHAGLALPKSAGDQFEKGETWDVVSGPDSEPGSLGGHWVYLPAYSNAGLFYGCVTWGKRQLMTKRFWDAYVVIAVGIVDNRDKWLGAESPVNVPLLDSYLQEVTK